MRKILLLGIISMTLILSLTVTRVSAVPGTAVIAVEPRYVYEPTSTEFTINLTVMYAEDIQSWEANITFDPVVLEFVSCAEGEFLKRKGIPTDFLYDNRTERVLLSAAYLMIGPPGVGITGSGQLANITFRVKTDVSAIPIHLDDEYTTLTYNNGTDPALQPRLLWDGFFTLVGDIDCDGDVDWVDFGDFATSYGKRGPPQVPVPEPNFNYRADFDSDGDVDWVDFGDFATNYGESIGP